VSRIDFLGHATTLIELDGTRFLTVPLLRLRISGLVHRHPEVLAPPPAPVDAVLISHLHNDHLDLPSLKLLGTHTHILAPRRGQALLRRAGFGNAREARPGDRVEVNGLPPLTTRAVHWGLRAPLGPWGGCVGYIIDSRQRVYFAGDTQAFSGMRKLGPIDVALMANRRLETGIGSWPYGSSRRGGRAAADSTTRRDSDPLGLARAARPAPARVVVPDAAPVGLRRTNAI
jgi:L-ascorbate metabolism protein UlaG (beta-lactamase superfamily)